MKTRNGLFADVPENLWNDWHWQVANRAETIEDLKKYMNLTPDEEAGVAKTLGKLRMAVTPYYLSLIDLDDPFDPIRKMAIPRAEELEYADYEDADPLHEDTDSPTPGLTHRYPDRVLLLVGDQQQHAVGIAVSQAGGGRVGILVQRIGVLVIGILQLLRAGDRHLTDGIERIVQIDQGQIVGGNSHAQLAQRLADTLLLIGGQGHILFQVLNRLSAVGDLPMPVVPQILGNIGEQTVASLHSVSPSQNHVVEGG